MDPTPAWRTRTTRPPRCAHHTRRPHAGARRRGGDRPRPVRRALGGRAPTAIARLEPLQDALAMAVWPRRHNVRAPRLPVGRAPVPRLSHVPSRQAPRRRPESPDLPTSGCGGSAPLDDGPGACCTRIPRASDLLAPAPVTCRRRPATTPRRHRGASHPRHRVGARATKWVGKGTRTADTSRVRAQSLTFHTSIFGMRGRHHAPRHRRHGRARRPLPGILGDSVAAVAGPPGFPLHGVPVDAGDRRTKRGEAAWHASPGAGDLACARRAIIGARGGSGKAGVPDRRRGG